MPIISSDPIRKATVRTDAGESYIDLGPGRREWSMVILCINDLLKYDGTATRTTGQQYWDALKTSYTGSVGTTINFTDPLDGSAILFHFDSDEETIRDLHSQIINAATGGRAGASYELKVNRGHCLYSLTRLFPLFLLEIAHHSSYDKLFMFDIH